ncbi:hypothetical protein MATL_G00264750 [Megalops atlanticus]|uniref:Uncharacterized protein n=1 Tax=Megalops atlanticus TaxID=7932 RepID=A0A9D3P9I5_MEGAT|nr:hypothetical protein MATL_G00264750 [Megalops atlanticus]
MRKKSETPGERERGTDTQSSHPDPQTDTYTALKLKAVSLDYDTLKSVRATASDSNTVFSEYGNLQEGRTNGV